MIREITIRMANGDFFRIYFFEEEDGEEGWWLIDKNDEPYGREPFADKAVTFVFESECS